LRARSPNEFGEVLAGESYGREEANVGVKPTKQSGGLRCVLRGLAFEARNGAWMISYEKHLVFMSRRCSLTPSCAAWARLSVRRRFFTLATLAAATTCAMREEGFGEAQKWERTAETRSPRLLSRRVLADEGLAKTTFTSCQQNVPAQRGNLFPATIALDDDMGSKHCLLREARALDPLNAELLADTGMDLRRASTISDGAKAL